MHKLYFDLKKVKRLAEIARKDSAERIATALQAFDEKGNEIENLVVPAALNWRIDFGVFLYPNNILEDDIWEAPEYNLFAEGWNPKKDVIGRRENQLLEGRFLEHPVSLEWIERVTGNEKEGYLVILVLPDDGYDLEWVEDILY